MRPVYTILRPILFALEPEKAHTLTLEGLHLLKCVFHQKPICKPTQVMGLNFPNPVGLAAGLDKNGDYIDALSSLGFGFIEVGTVTPLPQPGNPKPRLFRLPEEVALINRMGFNNKGVDHLVQRILKAKFKGILGVNIGKNANTPIKEAHQDYLTCLRKVYSHASYVVVNISSPNTPDLKRLQFGSMLKNLLEVLKNEQKSLWESTKRYTPLVVKISPDLTELELNEMSETLLDYQIDGVIATNTTLNHDHTEKGGLSGKPLSSRALSLTHQLARSLKGKIPIIASGGIVTAEDASLRFQAGASLVQLYTGFIYEGPQLIQKIASES